MNESTYNQTIMEKWQQEHILENLAFLIKNTMCTIGLLTQLQSKHAISSEEAELIVSTINNIFTILKVPKINVFNSFGRSQLRRNIRDLTSCIA